jgi:SAM-dependent methyltransferase
MYGAHADFYDPIYAFKDYAAESSRLRALLSREGIAEGSAILEAGCGTGAHLLHLSKWYRASGFDLNPGMLACARRKLPESVLLFEADMAAFDLATPVDAVISLFGSIGYVHPLARLEAAASCFFRALRPGGVLIVEPFVAPEVFVAGRTFMHTYDGPELKLCRMSSSAREGDLAELHFHWTALRSGALEPERFSEKHTLYLIPSGTMLEVFTRAGFEARFDRSSGFSDDRGILIAGRPA